jgi:hypothetical protein
MTSISATAGSSNYLSPLQLLQNELQTEVSSGAISSSDQSALSSALNDINSSLQNDGSTKSSSGCTGSSDASAANDILQQFLQSLQSSPSNSSSSPHSATGSTAASSGNSSFAALLINYQT